MTATQRWPSSVVGNHQSSRRADACAMASSRAGESMVGRAGRCVAWVLVEHPGPWPASAPDGVLPVSVTQRSAALVGRLRVLLIRRPRVRPTADPLCVICWTDGTRHWMREKRLRDYDDLLALDFESIAAGVEQDFGVERDTPLIAVCTHGKKDACCAELGRPIVTALSSTADADVWECTHVGGDRFAANLVAFPHGLFFSRLGGDSAREVVASCVNGSIDLSHFRGRAALSPAAQAAEHAVREATGITRIDSLRAAVDEDHPESGGRVVEIVLGSRRFAVVVRSEPQDQIRHGCTPGGSVAWNRWVVVDLRELPAAVGPGPGPFH